MSVYQEYKDQGLRVYAISNETSSTLKDYRDYLGLTLPILVDTGDVTRQQYRLKFPFPTGAYPQDFLISGEGKIIYQNNRFEAEAMKAAIEAELLRISEDIGE
ncbi:MAG: peroxiredoxin [Cognaticolwellia sp.]